MAFSTQSFRLDGKVAVVTGAGGRGNSIGAAFAHALAGAGASLLVASRSDGARVLAEEIAATGADAASTVLDVSDPASVKAMAAFASERFGGVDILVNNAAMMAEIEFRQAIQTALADWNRILAVNLTGALLCSQALVPAMRARGGGRIVNIASAGAFPAASVYGISKIALVGLTTTLARELGRDNITVNAIAPGVTMSDAGKTLVPPGSPYGEMQEALCTMRAFGEPDELAGALLLLASAAGDWITGQVLHVDGGAIIRP